MNQQKLIDLFAEGHFVATELLTSAATRCIDLAALEMLSRMHNRASFEWRAIAKERIDAQARRLAISRLMSQNYSRYVS